MTNPSTYAFLLRCWPKELYDLALKRAIRVSGSKEPHHQIIIICAIGILADSIPESREVVSEPIPSTVIDYNKMVSEAIGETVKNEIR